MVRPDDIIVENQNLAIAGTFLLSLDNARSVSIASSY
jgi:hypothetical protein